MFLHKIFERLCFSTMSKSCSSYNIWCPLVILKLSIPTRCDGYDIWCPLAVFKLSIQTMLILMVSVASRNSYIFYKVPNQHWNLNLAHDGFNSYLNHFSQRKSTSLDEASFLLLPK